MIAEPSVVELGPFSNPGAVLTPWDDTLDALRRTPKYWLATVRPDGRPHVASLLAAVALDGICFVTGPDERKSKNMTHNANVVISTGSNSLTGRDYVIEGQATLRTDPDELADAAATFESTFGWHLTHPDGNWHGMGDMIRHRDAGLWQVLPVRGFANADAKNFSQTRYVWNR